MKYNFLKFVLCILSLFTMADASAKYFVEPHLGYIVTGSSDQAGTNTYSGPIYGMKFGYYQKEAGFNFGLDVIHSSYTFATKEIASTASTRNEFGLFGGYNSQNKLRMWAGVYYTRLDGSGNDYYSGHTFEIGAGYAVAQRVSLNVYYRLISYTSYTLNDKSTDYSPALSSSELAIAVSFPFEL